MTGEMKEGVKVDVYIEEKKVVNATPIEDTTPAGDAIYKIKFDDESEVTMTNRKFQAIQTIEKSDATSARAALTKEVGKRMYALLMEYGVKFSEIDPILNETVRLVNDGQNAALDILWGNEGYDRSLLDVNRVLLTKYGEETATDNDESAPEGGVADSANA